MRTALFFGLVCLSLGVCACSSDSTEGTPDPSEGKTFEQEITAAAGGTLKTDNDSAVLEVPAGALAADTTLTLKVAAKEADTATAVYEFGPSGTKFDKPAELAIAYDGDPGTDKKAVLANYSDGKWVEVAGSAVAGGNVTAEISHFSKFTIIIIDDKAVVVSDCADVAENFTACGGDVQGTWKFQDVCFESFPLGAVPWQSSCPEATAEFELVWDATITIDASTLKVAWASQKGTFTFTAPKSCLPADAACSDISDDDMTCADSGEKCECVRKTEVTDLPEMTMDYTVDGTNLKVTDPDGEESVSPFCRQGDKLITKQTMEAQDEMIPYFQVLVKQ